MAGNVDSKHPFYTDRAGEWLEMRDCARGATAVQGAGETYLPMPSGFAAQEPAIRDSMYGAYLTRAQFPELLAPTIRGMIGVIHRSEATIELPEALEPLRENATTDGLPLDAFHRRLTGELLTCGRYGILTDASKEGSDVPFLAGYRAETVINWNEERTLFVLDESGQQLEGFEWRNFRRHRVLKIDDGKYVQEEWTADNSMGATSTVTPTARGGKQLEEIPFVIVGSRDLSTEPDDPPLIGVARASLALYRLDADYRHQLYMSGQETLFIIGATKDERPAAVGAGVIATLPEGTDAKYVGPSGSGIEAHRTAIIDERDNAVAAGARLFDQDKSAATESGEAKRLRYTAQTATLTSIAKASAAGLEKALKHAAVMVGADPDEVVVKPNLKFIDTVMTPAEAKQLVELWQQGAFSKQTLYENMQRGEIVSDERDFEDEQELVDAEERDNVDVAKKKADTLAAFGNAGIVPQEVLMEVARTQLIRVFPEAEEAWDKFELEQEAMDFSDINPDGTVNDLGAGGERFVETGEGLQID